MYTHFRNSGVHQKGFSDLVHQYPFFSRKTSNIKVIRCTDRKFPLICTPVPGLLHGIRSFTGRLLDSTAGQQGWTARMQVNTRASICSVRGGLKATIHGVDGNAGHSVRHREPESRLFQALQLFRTPKNTQKTFQKRLALCLPNIYNSKAC